MILATLKNKTRDGELLVVSQDRKHAVRAIEHLPELPTLQSALDSWHTSKSKLSALFEKLSKDPKSVSSFALDPKKLHSPLPRAYAWLDGSAFINHVVLVRKARGVEPPATLKTDPLMYQGGSDHFLSPTETIPVITTDWGVDFESEVCVITDDVPMGTSAQNAGKHIQLVVLCNDVTLRNLTKVELEKGFGFLQSKPSSSFSPLAITPDELGDSWKDFRVHLPLTTTLNGKLFGNPDAGPEMYFSFADLIAHAAKTRPLSAGTIVGSGTVSNSDRSRGSSCLAEKRMIEQIDTGTITTPFMQYGDRVEIEMIKNGVSLFGKIDQTVAPYAKP